MGSGRFGKLSFWEVVPLGSDSYKLRGFDYRDFRSDQLNWTTISAESDK